MLILAFDTTNNNTSACLSKDNKILQKITINQSGQQSEKLIPILEEILTKNNVWYQNLNLISYSNGPGSFTGIRIALATAKALNLTTKIPLIAINSTEVIAQKYLLKYPNLTSISIAIDARSDEFFVAKYLIKNNILELQDDCFLLGTADIENYFDKKDFFLAGSGKYLISEKLKNAKFDEEEDVIESDLLANLAFRKFQENPKITENPKNHQPFYARDPKISKRKVK